MSKLAIKKDILNKLGLKEAPNVDVNSAPLHLINQMKKRFPENHRQHNGYMGDAPDGYHEYQDDEDSFFQTRLINILGQDGK